MDTSLLSPWIPPGMTAFLVVAVLYVLMEIWIAPPRWLDPVIRLLSPARRAYTPAQVAQLEDRCLARNIAAHNSDQHVQQVAVQQTALTEDDLVYVERWAKPWGIKSAALARRISLREDANQEVSA